jgi:hypothetical protein
VERRLLCRTPVLPEVILDGALSALIGRSQIARRPTARDPSETTMAVELSDPSWPMAVCLLLGCQAAEADVPTDDPPGDFRTKSRHSFHRARLCLVSSDECAQLGSRVIATARMKAFQRQ